MTARWSVLMKSYRDAAYNRKQIERRKQHEYIQYTDGLVFGPETLVNPN